LDSGSSAHVRENWQATKKPRIEENYSEGKFESLENGANDATDNGITSNTSPGLNKRLHLSPNENERNSHQTQLSIHTLLIFYLPILYVTSNILII